MNQDEEDQIYSDWFAEEEDKLKESYLMSQTHEDLKDFLLQEREETIFAWYENSFMTHCEEDFKQHLKDVYGDEE